jgi:hypothetical protein
METIILHIKENTIYCQSKDIFKNIENTKYVNTEFSVPVTESNKTQLIENINDFQGDLEDTNFNLIDKKEFIKTLEDVAKNSQPSETKKDNGLLNKDLSKEDLEKIYNNFQKSENKAIIDDIIELLYPGLSSAEDYTVPIYRPDYCGDDISIKTSPTHIHHNLTSYLLKKEIITKSIDQATLDQILTRFNLTQNTDNNTTENYLDIVTANFGKEGGSYKDSKDITLRGALSCYLMAYEISKNENFLKNSTATCLENSLKFANLTSEKSTSNNNDKKSDYKVTSEKKPEISFKTYGSNKPNSNNVKANNLASLKTKDNKSVSPKVNNKTEINKIVKNKEVDSKSSWQTLNPKNQYSEKSISPKKSFYDLLPSAQRTR